MSEIIDKYNEDLILQRHYPTTYSNISEIIKESSYLLYDFKDVTEEIEYDDGTKDVYVKEKSPLFYSRVIDSESNQELLSVLTEEVPYYYLSPSIYVDDEKIKLLETRDIGINNVPSALQENEFYETWFRDASGYIKNLLILDGFNKLRYPYINENQYLYAQVFSRMANSAFEMSNDSESRIEFNDSEEDNLAVYDSDYKFFGEEIGSTDYLNDIIEKKIISNYVFIDFSSEQSNFLTNTVNSLYESGQISYSDIDSEKLIFKLQEIKNELLRRKLSGTYSLYKLVLSSMNRNGSFVGVIKASDVTTETPSSLTTAKSANGNRPIRMVNTPGFITKTVNEYDHSIDPIASYYTNRDPDEQIPLDLIVPLYYTSSDVQKSLVNEPFKYNNEAFYTYGYTTYEDSNEYESYESRVGGHSSNENKYQFGLLRDNSNVIQLDSLEGIISQDNLQDYPYTLDSLYRNELGETVYRTLDSTIVSEKAEDEGKIVPYSLDRSYSMINFEMIYSNVLDINADHIMYHYNSVQQKLGEYYDYLTYPIADRNGVCLMDTFWLNYLQYQLNRKTKVNDNTMIGTQVNTFIDMSDGEDRAFYEFFGVSYEEDDDNIDIDAESPFKEYTPDAKFVLIWYCVITYDTTKMKIVKFDKTLISKIRLKEKAPTSYLDATMNLKSEYKDCEPFTKYNLGIIPFTYKDFVNNKVKDLKIGFYGDTFKDDAASQGYGKSMFIFSQYDLTSYSPDKNIDPYELDTNPGEHTNMFTNTLCENIKTIYYAVKKTEVESYANYTKSGHFKEEDGSIIESEVIEKFVWSDPIRVVDLNSFYELIKDFSERDIHFSPDWKGLSYYLNPYLNFTDKSASPLRHKKVYQAYNPTISQVPYDNPEVDEDHIVNSFIDLLDKDAYHGDIYYVNNQSDYYIYNSTTRSWDRLETRSMLEGPSTSSALSNLCRMRRLDFTSNDLGEIAPTYWIDDLYHPEFELTSDHPAYSVYGLYLDKVQPSSIDRSHSYKISANIKGDNRQKDTFDVEYNEVVHLKGDIDLTKITNPKTNVLYSVENSGKYIYVESEGTGNFIRLYDSDLEKRSDICYDKDTNFPCISIDNSYVFKSNIDSEDPSVFYNNYLKLSPCSEEALKRDIIYTGISKTALINKLIRTAAMKESFGRSKNSKKLYETSDNIVHLYNKSQKSFIDVNASDYELDEDLAAEAKKNWYWDRESQDGITLCFNIDFSEEELFKEFTGEFTKGETYYFKDETGTFSKKRPTDYPAEITSEDNIFVEKYEQVAEGTGDYKISGYGTKIGNYFYEPCEDGDYVKTDDYEQVTDGVYNPKVKYFRYNGESYVQIYVEDSNYGRQLGFIADELYHVTFDLVDPSEYTVGEAVPERKYYTKNSNDEYVLCANEIFDENTDYYEVSELAKTSIDEQFSNECVYYEPIFSEVRGSSNICFDDANYITSYFRLVTLDNNYSMFVQCSGTEVIQENETYYRYVNESYDPVTLEEVGSYFKAIYVLKGDYFSVAHGKYIDHNNYYVITGFKKYEVENLYNSSAIGKRYYVSSGMESTQVLAYRQSSSDSVINAEFMLSLEQITNKDQYKFNFTVYPDGQSSNSETVSSKAFDTSYLKNRNVRISASAYKESNSKIVMSIVVDGDIEKYEVTGEDFSIFPIKYSDSSSNGLGDIVLFTQINNDVQYHNFYGNIYDFRLYNSGKSPEELLLLNMGTMRELYSYSPSVYKLAHSLYNDLSYLRIVHNVEESKDKEVGAIRVFNRSVWDSIYVDNYPVSAEEMDPTSPQYYENYINPLYDTDVYQMDIKDRSDIRVSLKDCIEQSLMNRLEVFNGREVQDTTVVSYNNKTYTLTTEDIVTAVFSTMMPINYDKDSIVSENIDFNLNGNTVVSNTAGDNEPIKIYLPIDSSDDYFSYSADISPNFKINSDFNLAMWLSKGTNISLTYNKKLEDSYVTVLDNSKKDSNVNTIVVPLVLPKQTNDKASGSVGYIDKFMISNFRLNEAFVRLLRATSYYSELRIPLPCYKKGKTFVPFDASDLIGEAVPNYFLKNEEENTYYPVNTGLLEQGKTYYRYNGIRYVEATDIRYGSAVSHYYVLNNPGSGDDRYISVETNEFEANTEYYKYALTDAPTFYNKWDGIRILKEGTYYVTCKYPLQIQPFNDDEFDSVDKSNYATVYATARFKVEVSSKPKEMCESEKEKYAIKGIPQKYTTSRIKATLQNKSELVNPDDNRTFPHRDFTIKLYALDVNDSKSGLAGYMKKVGDSYEEQYNFEWKLIASNQFYDCFSQSFTRPTSISANNTYFKYNESTGKYIKCGQNEVISPSTCYEFNYASTGVLYLNKENLDDCIITSEVPLFMSKNYTMPFFVAGQEKVEDDEDFGPVEVNDNSADSTSADDDLIEPIRIRPNFTKVNTAETINEVLKLDEKIKAESVDDLDHLLLIAGKSYKVLFDYTSKISEFAFTDTIFETQTISPEEKIKYCRYYSLIDSLKVLDSDYQYVTSGEEFTIPSSYDNTGAGVSASETEYEEAQSSLTIPGTPIPENIYYTRKDDKYSIATGVFEEDETYYTRQDCTYLNGIIEDKLYFGDPSAENSNENSLLNYTSSVDNIVNSYKIYYMVDVTDDMKSVYDVYANTVPSKSVRIGTLMGFTNKQGNVGQVSDFSEPALLKTLYNSLISDNIVSDLQSDTVGAISGFTKVSPNISYRRYNDVNQPANGYDKFVEITSDSHELYSYASSSRQVPYKNNFDIKRTTCFRNNLLKGKQLELLNKNYWDLSGSYSHSAYVEDPNFGKTVVKFSDVESLELLYDGGGYELQSKFEAAINVKADDLTKISKIYVTYYDSVNNIVKAYAENDTSQELKDNLELTAENPVDGIVNYHISTGLSIKSSKIRFKFEMSGPTDIWIGKIIVRGNGTTKLANGLANVYYSNSFVDSNVIMASHLVPVFKDLETDQYIPIQFKNGTITANGITRPNPGLNLASLFISKNMDSKYSTRSKISKLNLPWIRRFYYDHAGLEDKDNLENSAYFHKYSTERDSMGVPYRKEIFGNSTDIFSFTKDSDGKVNPDKSVICTRVIDNDTNTSYFTINIGNNDESGKLYGIVMNLDKDGTLSYFGNNLIVNSDNPINVSEEAVSMTYNCFNLENYRNNISSSTVVTNVQLLDNKIKGSNGSYDSREVLYELEYLPIIYDELIHHVSFNIMIKKKK